MFERRLYLSQILTITLVVLLVNVLMMVVSGMTNDQPVQWSSCPLHSEFQMPEGLKHFPRSLIPSGPSFGQVLTFVDALNELNMKKNDVYRTKAECTKFSTPLNHNDDKIGQPLNLFVKRLRADPTKDAPRALWLLNGGPAMASDSFELPMDILIKMLGGQFDIYTTDHRGTGRSNRTTCGNSESSQSDEGVSISMKEWAGCAQAFYENMNGTAQFLNSKEAAIDVVKLIQSINVPKNQKVFVYGLSYGTVWTSRMIRYLQLTNQESLISGYILDGVVNVIGKPALANSEYTGSNRNGRLVLNLWDEHFNAIGQSLMEMCGGSIQRFATNQFINYNSDNTLLNRKGLYEQKTECALKLEKKSNGNPVEFMKKVIENVYVKNTCSEFSKNVQLLQLKLLFQGLLMQPSTRSFIPAIIYRLDRCHSTIDIPVLLRIAQGVMEMFNVKPTAVPLASEVLKYHIMFSELWDKNVTLQQLMSQYMDSNSLIGGFGVGMQSILDTSKWPIYTLDPDYLEQSFETNVPILMMNGNLDPNTPLWSALAQKEAIKSNSHNLVVIPFAPHATITGSGYGNSSIPAALQVMVNFISMETPNAFTVDTICLNSIKFNTSGDPYVNERLIGITNIYEDYFENTTPTQSVSSANTSSMISLLIVLVSLMISILF